MPVKKEEKKRPIIGASDLNQVKETKPLIVKNDNIFLRSFLSRDPQSTSFFTQELVPDQIKGRIKPQVHDVDIHQQHQIIENKNCHEIQMRIQKPAVTQVFKSNTIMHPVETNQEFDCMDKNGQLKNLQ